MDFNIHPLPDGDFTVEVRRPVSYAAEVIADSTGKWRGNSLRFATKQEADRYARNLTARWLAVRQHRVVPSDDPVTSTADERGNAAPLDLGGPGQC